MNGIRIIELTGLPGSGKTTLSSRIINNLISQNSITTLSLESLRGIKSFKPDTKGATLKYFKFIIFCILNFDLVFNSLRFSLSINPINLDSVKFATVLLRTMFFYENLTRRDENVFIIEEGILQNIWAITITGENYSSKYLHKLLENIKRKVKFIPIYVDINTNVAIQRVRNRQGNMGRFDKLNYRKLKSAMHRNKDKIKEIFRLYEKLDHNKTIILDGEARLDKKTNIVLDLIRELNGKEGI